MITYENWKKLFTEALVNNYGVSKKKARKIKNEVMKNYYFSDQTPENAAQEVSINFDDNDQKESTDSAQNL